ncbi:MAG: HD domain-containing protein [Dethiosulfatibacter sp.]|nr:HD domain-containing protein [Dethiosulfatibacter sp.]
MENETKQNSQSKRYPNGTNVKLAVNVLFFSSQIWKKALKYMVPLVIIAVAAAYFIYNSVKMQNLLQLQMEQNFIINVEANILDDDIDKVLTMLVYLLELDDKDNLFDDAGDARLEIVQIFKDSLIRKMKNTDIYTEAVMIDIDGNELFRLEKTDEGEMVVPDHELQSNRDDYYFDKVLGLEVGQTYISRMDVQSENGNIVKLDRPVIRFMRALRDQHGEIKGALVLNYNGKFILERMALADQQTNNLLLISADGSWIYGSEGFAHPEREMERFQNVYPNVWREILNKDQGSLVTSEGSFVFKKVDLYRNLGIDYVTDDGSYPWILVSLIPDTILSQTNLNTLITISVITTLFVLLVACIIVLALRSNYSVLIERDNLKTMYRSLVNTQQEMICRYLSDTTLIYVNDSYCQAFEKSRDELIGRKYLEFIPPEFHKDELAALKRLSPAHPVDTREFEVTDPEGNIHWQEWTDVALFNEAGETIEIQGTGRDITENKQAKEEILRQRDRIDAILMASSRLNANMELKTIYQIVCEEICSSLQVPWSLVLRYDTINQGFHLVDGMGLTSEMTRNMEPLPWEIFDTIIQKTGNAGIMKDLTLVPNLAYAELILKHEMKQLAYSVIKRKGVTLGVLMAGTRTEFLHPDDSVALLEGLADQTASAITNAELFKETVERLRQVQALRNIDLAITGSLDLRVTFQVILDEVTRMLGTDAAAILRLDPYSGNLKYEQWRGFQNIDLNKIIIPMGKGYGGRIALNRQSIQIHDLRESEQDSIQDSIIAGERFNAYYGVPLIAKGLVLGVLEVFHRDKLNSNGDWLSFLETLAGQAAIAVDNAELFSKLERTSIDLLRAYDATIEGWAHALDLKDEETEEHSRRVTELTMRIARKMGITEENLVHVRRGALLHDIGKMGIPDSILLKPGKLTDEEWDIMRKHPVYAFEMLAPIDYLRSAMNIPYCHHERWDGSGYPRQLKGDQIPLEARIFAVIDVYDALTSDRPYRKAWTRKKVLEYIQERSGIDFDPKVVEVFMEDIGDQDYQLL